MIFSMASSIALSGTKNHSLGCTGMPKRSGSANSNRALLKTLCRSASSFFRLIFASLKTGIIVIAPVKTQRIVETRHPLQTHNQPSLSLCHAVRGYQLPLVATRHFLTFPCICSTMAGTLWCLTHNDRPLHPHLLSWG